MLFFKDNRFYLLVALGFISVLLPGHSLIEPRQLDFNLFMNVILIAPVMEELIFRKIGYSVFSKGFFNTKVLEIITFRNIILSLMFCVFHLFNHDTVLALLTFFPSLVFGLCFERYKILLPSILIHAIYNFIYYISISSSI